MNRMLKKGEVAPLGPVTRPTREEAEEAVRVLLRWAGDNPDREGLLGTPDRVVRSYEEFFAGYQDDPAEIPRLLLKLEEGFDLVSGKFVGDGGFMIPKSKARVAWEDQDTLLISNAWSPGELTASGYPYIVKRLKRGQPLSAAVEVYRGDKADGGYGVSPDVLRAFSRAMSCGSWRKLPSACAITS